MLLSLLTSPFFAARAQELSHETTEAHFQKGRFEAALISGVLFSPFPGTEKRPTLHYTQTGFQIGRMLSDVSGDGMLAGNFQLVGEAAGGAVLDGIGDYVANSTLWLRYNIVQPGWRIRPFVQAGAGFTFADLDNRLVGQNFNFNLNLACGMRYFICDTVSLNLEYRYQHISNANLSDHNWGVNAHGPIVGVSWFF